MRKLKFLFVILAALLVVAMPAFAQGSQAAPSAGPNWVAITSGFAMALAVALAALGQGRVASAACEGMARNPSARPGIQLALILGLAFIESLVLFTLMIIFVKGGLSLQVKSPGFPPPSRVLRRGWVRGLIFLVLRIS